MPSVPDQQLVVDILTQIAQAISTIEQRFESVENVDYFLATEGAS